MQQIANGSTQPILFFMSDETDNKTAETGLTVTVQLSKNGGAFATAGGSVAEIGSGWYKLTPTSTDTNTTGALAIRATANGANEWRDILQVMASLPLTATEVNAQVDTALADYDAPTNAELTAGLAALNDLTAAEVWTYVTRELTSAGSGGATAQEVWEYATRALTANPGISAADVWAAATRTLTDNGNDISTAQVNAEVASVIAGLNDIAPADVWTYATRELTGLTLTEVERQAIADALLTRTMTETYAGAGNAPTVAQALYMLLQRQANVDISGTTVTVYRRDGVTVAYTLTVDDGEAPTSVSQG